MCSYVVPVHIAMVWCLTLTFITAAITVSMTLVLTVLDMAGWVSYNSINHGSFGEITFKIIYDYTYKILNLIIVTFSSRDVTLGFAPSMGQQP